MYSRRVPNGRSLRETHTQAVSVVNAKHRRSITRFRSVVNAQSSLTARKKLKRLTEWW